MGDITTSEAIRFSEQSSFAKSQLEHVAERLQNKMQALKVRSENFLGLLVCVLAPFWGHVILPFSELRLIISTLELVGTWQPANF